MSSDAYICIYVSDPAPRLVGLAASDGKRVTDQMAMDKLLRILIKMNLVLLVTVLLILVYMSNTDTYQRKIPGGTKGKKGALMCWLRDVHVLEAPWLDLSKSKSKRKSKSLNDLESDICESLTQMPK